MAIEISLGELVGRLQEFSGRPNARIWIPRNEGLTRETRVTVVVPAEEPTIERQNPDKKPYLLVWLAKEVLEVWSAWRDNRLPSEEEAIEALAYYAANDAYLPEA